MAIETLSADIDVAPWYFPSKFLVLLNDIPIPSEILQNIDILIWFRSFANISVS